MKATGIVRNIDELGRIVIPKEMRNRMDLPEGAPAEIFVEDGKICIARYYAGCYFCGSSDQLSEFKGKQMCNNCLSEINEMLK